jgi:hypothetical protein
MKVDSYRNALSKRLYSKSGVEIMESEFSSVGSLREIERKHIDTARKLLEDFGPVSACQYLICLFSDELSDWPKRVVSEGLSKSKIDFEIWLNEQTT